MNSNRLRRSTLLVIGLLFAGSAFPGMRLGLGPFSVHPYLVVVGPLLFYLVVSGTSRIPRSATITSALFLGLYGLSCVPGGGVVGELVKTSAVLTTALVGYLLVRSNRDYTYAAVGMVLAGAIIGLRGLAGGEIGIEGINPMEGVGNKNAYALFAIPALLNGALVATSTRSRRLLVLLGLAGLIIAGAVFSTGNRSGWIGVALVLAYVVALRRGSSAILFGALLVGGTYGIVTEVTTTSVLERRIEQTRLGIGSDTKRVELIRESFMAGFESPILGESPAGLKRRLGRRFDPDGVPIEAHNVYAHVFGGSGVVTFLAFWLMALSWRRKAPARVVVPPVVRTLGEATVVQTIAFLYLGFFTSEVLYSPMIFFGLGISAARYDRVLEAWVQAQRRAHRQAAQPPNAAHSDPPAVLRLLARPLLQP